MKPWIPLVPPFIHKRPVVEQPLRSQLFSPEQMQSYGKVLAESHHLSPVQAHGSRLLTRLMENEVILNQARIVLTEYALKNHRILPAADWLLDNFYLIEEQIQISKRDLPKGYSRGLPQLQEAQAIGFPRVYDIALERISHGDGLVEPETLQKFLESYQSVTTLTLGELWAIPIMLKLALIENLRRAASRILAEMEAQEEADSWADRMSLSAETDPKNLILLIADMARSDPPMNSSFVAELARKLQGKGSALTLPLTWIEQRLSETGLTIDQLVQSAMRQQAADQVSIGNSIRSLRSLGATNWKDFVESSSSVEKILKEDPAGYYEKMDFSTRDSYRHKVEELARKSNLTEAEIAGLAVQLAQEEVSTAEKNDRKKHVGYYLIDQGLGLLKRQASVRLSFLEIFKNKTINNHTSLIFYIGSAFLLASVMTLMLFINVSEGTLIQSWPLIVLVCFSFTSLALGLVNWIITLAIKPSMLPRLDFSQGIPRDQRTLVVVPAMLSSFPDLDHLVETLEIRWLANQDDNLFFGLLSDFPDDQEQITLLDKELLLYAQTKIVNLNNQYQKTNYQPFFLFHRNRKWNDHESKWMGHERKRGKLSDLNIFLQEGNSSYFDSIIGLQEQLVDVRYVITLDRDTQLPRNCARQLAGTLAHPLNRPVYDDRSGRIISGYGILQPRVSASLPGSSRSNYARMESSEPGLDPYTRATSDVYQDLFSEGSFIGKGIYDISAFQKVLKNRFPENQILSHDLLEGCYARSGYVSDIQFFEAAPISYTEDVDRRRRWIRGDWQLVKWLFPWVPAYETKKQKNSLSALSRWKLFDNLRRSLTSTALTALLILSWITLRHTLVWNFVVVAIIFIPAVFSLLHGLIHKSKTLPWKAHINTIYKVLVSQVEHVFFTILSLPYDAYFTLGAIFKTLWRVLITHNHLLEWRASDDKKKSNPRSLSLFFKSQWFPTALSLSLLSYLIFTHSPSLIAAIPLLLFWSCAPFITWKLSQPIHSRETPITLEQKNYLRCLSRKTWSFFETFVVKEENWLPPDNYQEIPVPKIAHRTSPTNIGLSLLANLAAWDFGYISAGVLISRSSKTLQSMAKLERYHNHFYNWYDTQTLKPLLPRYVSTVDSGNLAAHLLTLKAGLGDLSSQKILGFFWCGLEDTLRILKDLVPESSLVIPFQNELESVPEPSTLPISELKLWLEKLAFKSKVLKNECSELNSDPVVIRWSEALDWQCWDALDELIFLVPWLEQKILPKVYQELLDVNGLPTLKELILWENQILDILENQIEFEKDLTHLLIDLVITGRDRGKERINILEELSRQTAEFAYMDFDFLYSKRRHLLSIGYNVDRHHRDSGFYDLLASEARLTSYIVIAQGQIPQENWFALGRSLVDGGANSLLFSWSGSMFEYLMPLLVMPSYEQTLLDQTCKIAVERQIEYGKIRGVPWGISESGYNAFDVSLNYQYRAFGVPGLGLKRGLEGDLVVAPYAAALALMVAPEKACRNLERLSKEGFEGPFGLYEAIDYTPLRIPSDQFCGLVKSFMAHHQGMSFLSLASCLLDKPMQKRFSSIPMCIASSLLLEEKIPRATTFRSPGQEMPELYLKNEPLRSPARVFITPDTPIPEVHLLSNGTYHVMVTNSGGGYSRWKDLAVTRWKEDCTRDNLGAFLYIRDIKTGKIWSNTFQPTLKRPETYEVIFSEGRAEFRRKDKDFETYTELTVSPEDDIELKRVRITNRSHSPRILELTSYSEVVLASASSDAAHPGFSNLFVQTEILETNRAILCTRRPRSKQEQPPWLVHLMTIREAEVLEVSYETDRMKFLGRGNTLVDPLAMKLPGILSGGQGSVLDPVVCIRYKIVLEPESSAIIDIVTGVSENRVLALQLAEKYQSKQFSNRAFELARTHSQVALQQINGTEADAQLYGHLASSVLYSNPALRAESNILIANRRGQSGLWGYSISGDLPLVLLLVQDLMNLNLVRQLVQAHTYWKQKGLAVDLVILNEEHDVYRQVLQEQILGLIAAGVEANTVDRPGGIFFRSTDQISIEDRILIQTVARIVLTDQAGTLEEQIEGRSIPKRTMLPLKKLRMSLNRLEKPQESSDDLLFFNGLGGFDSQGKEYIILTDAEHKTPAPWVNILANSEFGTVISESGISYTWSENAHEFRLTPWSDDPIGAESGEAFYMRDEETGQFWSPAPFPHPGQGHYKSRHGFGYTVFEHTEEGISSELWISVDVDKPVKISRLVIHNESGRPRKFSATAYSEFVLGEHRAKSGFHIITEIDEETGALLVKNRYSTDFSERVVFLDTLGENKTITGDRCEFVGRNGSLANPECMGKIGLSNRVGAGMDPCGAIQVAFELAEAEKTEIVFIMGSGKNEKEALDLIAVFHELHAAEMAIEKVKAFWKRSLSVMVVETPNKAFDILANGWLVYEILSSRLWGRSGYYQSGGAFGFRDQLQDAMSLVYLNPKLLRDHLLVCAAHQFVEGDVQHWWHPPGGRGSRTHCSDDYLWLPLAVCRYIKATKDLAVLQELIPFISGRPLNSSEESYYDLAWKSEQTSTLYEHCRRAISHGLKKGTHGLPLMGSGDWNDGMNKVGELGLGESVWLGFFLYKVLMDFKELALLQEDQGFALRCTQEALVLKENLEKNGWDEEWYRRAYFDDGTPLGSIKNQECKIDSISQSWSVLSEAGTLNRSQKAMDSLYSHLVRKDLGLIQLLDPPFNISEMNPGYIKGYLPGVRENGGQYTHAAVWAGMAFAMKGDLSRSWEVFDLLNPINHSCTVEKITQYKVEPYVMPADVYSSSTHLGRGGWTWYTGSAGWMYRFMMESLLGIRLEKNELYLDPHLPENWKQFSLTYTYLDTVYHITIHQNGALGKKSCHILENDHKEHWIE